MRIKFLFLFLCSILTLSVLHYENQLLPEPIILAEHDNAIAPATGREIIPMFTLPNLNNTPITTDYAKADITLLHFWATWCAPCIAELPELTQFVKNQHGRVRLVAISLDQNFEDILPFLTQLLGVTKQRHTTWLFDENKTLTENTFGVYKLPETLVINEKSELIHKFAGAVNWLDSEVQKMVFYKF